MNPPMMHSTIWRHRDFATAWQQLADRVLAGETLSADEALAVLECPDDELLDLLAAAYRVRRRWFGNEVQLYFLMNAKSGLCPEDCGYCSQSKVSEAEIPRYNLLSRDKLLDGARMAAERQARTYCIVISARGPNEREMRGRHDDRAGDQAAVQPEDLRLPGPAHARAGPAAEGLRRRSREPQPQHERDVTTAKSARRTPSRPRWPRSAPSATPAWRCAPAASSAWASGAQDVVEMAIDAARPGRAIDPGQLPEPDRRHAAGRPAATSIRATA